MLLLFSGSWALPLFGENADGRHNGQDSDITLFHKRAAAKG